MGLAAGAAAVTAAWATQLAAGPHDETALGRAITRQKVEAGVVLPGEPTNEHQYDAYTADQMLELAKFYAPDIDREQERANATRLVAARSGDSIKVSCIDDKLLQMQTVVTIVQPRFLTIRLARHDEMRMRGQFSIIHQAWQRVRVLSKEIDECLGDHVDFGTMNRMASEIPIGQDDPTRVPDVPKNIDNTLGDRPPEASTYQ